MRVLPQGAWFGLTRRRLRFGGLLVAAVLVLNLAIFGLARTLLVLESRRAAEFLEDLRNVQLGQTEASVMPLIERYRDESFERSVGGTNDYVMRVDPWHFYRPFPGPKWVGDSVGAVLWQCGHWRRALGLRAWVASGSVRISQGRVHSVWADVMVEGENEWLMGDWVYAAEVPSDETNHYKETEQFRPEMSRYFAHWTHLHVGDETGEGIMNLVTPAATAEELNAGRNINLRCLTSVRGCHSLCDLMPDAHRYMQEHDYPGLGWNSGSWGPQDRACQ